MIDWTKPIETVTGLPAQLGSVGQNGDTFDVFYEKDIDGGRFCDGPWIYHADGLALNDFLLDLRNVSPLTQG